MASNLMTMGLWWFLPGTITGYAQDFYYRVTTRAGDPFPEKGSPRWRRDYRAIFTLVILTYLLYTVYEADWSQQRVGDLYQILGVGHDIDTAGVKSVMRRFSVKYHPDKVPAGQRPQAQQLYLQLSKAADILSDPVKRFFYDRLGPTVFEYEKAGDLKTADYLTYTKYAVYGVAQTYLGSAVVLLLLGWTGYARQGRYWRWIIFFTLLYFEIATVIKPTFPTILSSYVNKFILALPFSNHPPLLPFQFLAILRTLSISANIAFNQLGPFYRSPSADIDDAAPEDVARMFGEQMHGLRFLASQSAELVGVEMRPFLSPSEGGAVTGAGSGMKKTSVDQADETKVREAVKRWLVHNEIRKDPQYRAAFERAMRRRNGEVIEEDDEIDLDAVDAQ